MFENESLQASADAVQLLDCEVVDTGPDPQLSVIWLHGLGADGHDFVSLVPQLKLDDLPAIRFIFPHARIRPVTINAGMQMRAWYDITSLGDSPRQDIQGISNSNELVKALLVRELTRGVKPSNLVLAGFSQGGAMALYAGLRLKFRLAGIISLSGYMLFADQLQTELNPETKGLPIFIGHGEQDPVVPCAAGQAAAQQLQKLGYAVKWQLYPMPHAVCEPEINDLSAWFRHRFQGE